MKKIVTSFFFLIYSFTIYSQDVVLQRTSDLTPQGYSIEGQAFLEELSNGELQLRLSDDFTTPPGPDVRILLGNALSQNGTVEIVNLSSIGHFNGANTFAVPASVNIDDFEFILFFCVNFQQFWASGTFGESSNPNGGSFSCQENTVSISNGDNMTNICPSDNEADVINFSNNLGEASSNYAYLITDENDVLQEVITGNSFDFEGSSSSTQRVHGIHFDGMLIPLIGSNRLQTTATDCFTHSADNGYVSINKTADCITTFQCKESVTATTNWAIEVDLCSTDGTEDIVDLKNNIFETVGDNYVYLITDEFEILQEVVFDSTYNFEGTGEETQRVYGLSYSGDLSPQIGQNRMNTTATDCFIHSGGNLFLTIKKTSACESTSTQDAFLQNEIEVFPNPSNGIFSINYNEVSNIERVQLFDNNGKLVLESSKVNQLEILNSGMYYVRFITNDSSVTKKIFVK